MRPREVARYVRDQMNREASKTRAYEKARVVGRDEDTGNTIVEYRGAEIALSGSVPQNLTQGQWIRVERSNAGLQVGGNSAYGAG